MTDVSRETSCRLDAFAALVHKWNPRINLVAQSTLVDLQTRHMDDSLQLAELARSQNASWLDIGSGGGFPGIVLAIHRQSCLHPTILMESDVRKATFLRTVIRELALERTKVIADRIEHAEPQQAHHVSARALAPLPKLLGYVHRHIAPRGTAWLMKGRNWRDECEEARADWRFEVDAIPSRTDPDSAILKISGVSHA